MCQYIIDTAAAMTSPCVLESQRHLLFTKYKRYLLLPMLLWYLQAEKTSVVLTLFLFLFFRSPSRISDVPKDILVSPADGTIMDIRHITDKSGEIYIHISIFLNVFNVHVQYSPCNGVVLAQRYKRGEFYPAYISLKSQYNERLETDIAISDENGDRGHSKLITVVQIAGQMAQRIDSFVKLGSNVKRGCHLGMIQFGSRVDLIVNSRDFSLGNNVNPGQTVTGGHSILFVPK